MQRSKKSGPSVWAEIGWMVLIKDDLFSSLQSSLGCVTAVLSGPDGIVWDIIVKTFTGEFKRPVNKIYPFLWTTQYSSSYHTK